MQNVEFNLLLFIDYCIILYANNLKPTFLPSYICSVSFLSHEKTITETFESGGVLTKDIIYKGLGSALGSHQTGYYDLRLATAGLVPCL